MHISNTLVGAGFGAVAALIALNTSSLQALRVQMPFFGGTDQNPVFTSVHNSRVKQVSEEAREFPIFLCHKRYAGQVADVREFYADRGVNSLEVPKSEEVCTD